MRVTVFTLLLSVLQVVASHSYSQKARISLNLTNVTIAEVLEKIEEQSEFYFLYNTKLIETEKEVSVNVKKEQIRDVLDQIFENKVEYSVHDRQIVLLQGKSKQQSEKFKLTGIVKSADVGEELPGVSIVVKGTTIGTATDISGAFSLDVKKGEILVVSFIGMETKEYLVTGEEKNIEIQLRSNALQVDEVVVVAYGVQKKSEITGAISTVSASKIAAVPSPSIDKALQGRVAGVFIESSSGSPGSAAKVRIRGNSSLGGENQPLYVVDGIIQNIAARSAFSSTVALSPLSTIPASDIESVSVLKDAAAMSIYGSRAANGVIMITTKSGRSGKTKYQIDSRYGIDFFPSNSKWEKLDPRDELILKREGVKNVGGNPDVLYPLSLLKKGGTDWIDLVMRDGKVQEHSFSARGGNEKTTFYSSLTYLNQEGIVNGSDLERASIRVNLDHKSNETLSFGIKSGLTRSESSNVEMSGYAYENPFAAAMQLSSLRYPKNEDGSWNVTDLPAAGNVMNPIAMLENNIRSSEVLGIKNSMYVKVNFLKDLSFKTEFSYDIYNNDEILRFVPPTAWDDEGSHYESKGLSTNWSFKNLLTYDKQIGQKHHVNVLIGYEAEEYKYNYLNVEGTSIDQDIPYFVSGLENYEVYSNDKEYAFCAALGKASYNFGEKYYLAGSFRRDGSSKFGKNKRYANFGSISGSWRITSEEFAKKIGWLNDLKLRASYGTSGNSSLKNFYESRGTYGVTSYHKKSGYYPTKIANDDLTWEKNRQIDVGLDFGLFNRLSGSLDVYKRKSSGMLLRVPLSLTTGFDKALRNVAEMDNKGIDIELRAINLTGKFSWETNLAFSYVHNEVTKLNGSNIHDGSYGTMVGMNMDSFFPIAYAGVDPTNGKEMWWHIEYEKDSKGQPYYDKEISRQITYDSRYASRHYGGSLSPKYTGSVDNTFSYKGFQLNVMFSFSTGNKVWAADNFFMMHNGRQKGGFASPALNRWQKPGDRTDVPIQLHNNSNPYVWDDRHAYNGDYLRLRNVSLSYSLDKKLCEKLHLNSVKLYVQGTNLYTWHSVENFDPDRPTSGGFKYPNPKSFSTGISLNF